MNSLDTAFRFNETALKIGSQRQQVIASNMANADTPGYRAGDVNFADALSRATGESTTASGARAVASVTVRTTRPGHIERDAGAVVVSTADVGTARSTQPTVDANTVDMDAERAAFADNSVRYEASFSFLNHQIKTRMSAITG